jgi:uncharacterized membrane protein
MPLFESVQSKAMLFMALPVIVLTQMKKFDITQLFTHLILFLALAYNTDCLVEGRCRIWAWVSLIFPLIMVIGYLFFSRPLEVPPPVRIPVTSTRNEQR